MQKQENLSLYDSVISGLTPGTWQFATSQKLLRGKEELKTESISSCRSVIVEEALFSVDKELVVHRAPLPDKQGCYTNVIPHAVLKGAVGRGCTDFVLLLLKKEELEENAQGSLRETTVQEYLTPKTGILLPSLSCKAEETASRVCTCLRLSLTCFDRIAPRRSELPFLTHYRQVYIGDKPEMDLDKDGIFTVVLSNRIPVYTEGVGTEYQAHLVCLSGLENYLTGHAAGTDGYEFIELLSLDHWSFSVTGKHPDSFRSICERLNREGSISDMLLRLPVREGMEAVKIRLREGFVPMRYHTRTGDEGLCWNRSPFTPLKISGRKQKKPFETADAALCYDRKDAVFDVSLAAAFEAGRMAALKDSAYLDALLQLRRKAQKVIDAAYVKEMSGFCAGETYSGSLSRILSETEYEEQPGGGLENTVHVISGPEFPDRDRERLEAYIEKQEERLLPLLDDEGKPVARWLARLLLFYPLPYDSLVPHEGLLPRECVRFFFIDESWRQALYDGALSIGLYSGRQSLFNRLIRKYLYQASEEASMEYRAGLYGQKPPQKAEYLSGFLIRADMVSLWPSVSVEAKDQKGNSLALLRMEHLAPEILLAIFDGVAEYIVVNEPEEALTLHIDTGEYPAFRGEDGVLCLEPEAPDNLIVMAAEKSGQTVEQTGSAALAKCFLTMGERTIFGKEEK